MTMNKKISKSALKDTLRDIFGFQAFRESQEPIIDAVFSGRDVFAVMPTGGGKSLCYQLPATMLAGTAVIISPLISLMKDQVDAAAENGIESAFINSSMDANKVSEVYEKLRQDKIKLLYIAPERFAMPHFLEKLKTLKISLFAIDEAHCISEWGHAFRPDYLALAQIPKMFSGIPVAAFTATATQKVQADIIEKIGLRDPFQLRASFNRPNLFYEVKEKVNLQDQVMEFLKERKGEPGIIYRTSRKSVEETADFLKSEGISALPYHAGLSAKARNNNQEAFNKDTVQIIVATIAFGMGIDKSNVRFVVHGDLPKNIEGYYQETGRAGRDGEPAHCMLYFGRGDIPKIRYFINQVQDDAVRAIETEKLYQTVGFATHNICRRRQLLGFFGEAYPADNCGTCDICTGSLELIDITIEAQKIMSAISRTGQRFGAGHVIDIVTGSNTKRIRELQHDQIKTFGAGKDKDKRFWRSIIDEIVAQGAVLQEGDKYPILTLTEKGNEVLFGRETIRALKKEELPARAKKKKSAGGDYDTGLFEKLRIMRKRLADDQNVPPYIIFSDKTLHDMCRSYPVTPEAMTEINGVGKTKLERYGREFIDEISNYLESNPAVSAPGV
ncbi:MAG: DNA helicase RecQ [Nitrospira sp.]|nr:DNA helicase RecQ [bacterium]MBL7049253.1 DNA helicase RecQ [Nitrospira sp.]